MCSRQHILVKKYQVPQHLPHYFIDSMDCTLEIHQFREINCLKHKIIAHSKVCCKYNFLINVLVFPYLVWVPLYSTKPCAINYFIILLHLVVFRFYQMIPHQKFRMHTNIACLLRPRHNWGSFVMRPMCARVLWSARLRENLRVNSELWLRCVTYETYLI